MASCNPPIGRPRRTPRRQWQLEVVVFPVVTLAIWIAVAIRPAFARDVILTGEPFLLDTASATVALLEDTSGSLGPADVMAPASAARFVPTRGSVPSFGLTDSAVWMKFVVRSESDRDEIVVADLGMTRMSRFDWFVMTDDGTCEQAVACGSSDPPPSGGGRSRYPTLFFTVPPGEARTVLARATSDASIWLPLTIGSAPEVARLSGLRDLHEFVHLGFCSALALVSAGLWLVSGRQKVFLIVAAAMAIALVHVAIFTGTYQWLGIPVTPWILRQGALVLCMLFAWMFTLFTLAFFGKENLSSSELRVLGIAQVATIAIAMVCAILPNRQGVLLSLPGMVVAYGISGAVTLAQWRRRRLAGLGVLMLAWALLIGTTLLSFLQFTGLVPILASPMTLMRVMLPATLFVFLIAGASSRHELMEARANLAGLRHAETQARLDALHHQLNPHFLFNTLTSIDELSHEAPSRIPALVGRLSGFLRSLLESDGHHDVSLAREMEAVRAYLDIEQVRFEERMQVEYDIRLEAQTCLVPSFLTMPLVENAVKHGFCDDGTLHLRLTAEVRGDRLVVRVANRGVLQPERGSRGYGIGTSNLRERLRYQFGNSASFRLTDDHGWVTAEVDLPARWARP